MATSQHPPIVNLTIAVVLTVTAIKALYSIVRIITTSAPDFLQYYETQTSLLPPVSRLLFLPLRLLPFSVSQGAWVIVSFVCLLWIVGRLGKQVGLTYRGIVVASVLAFFAFPTRFTLGMGQVNLIVLACLVMAGSHSSGLWYAISVLLKPEPIFLTVPLAIQKKLLVLVFMIVIAFLMVVGWEFKLPEFRWADASVYYNQGLSGLISRAGGPFWMYGALAFILLGSWVYVIRKKKITLSETVWFFLPTFILIEPIAWQHHFVFLIPTYMTLWQSSMSVRRRCALVISYVLIGWNFASPGFLATMPLGWLVASHATIGALILWILSL